MDRAERWHRGQRARYFIAAVAGIVGIAFTALLLSFIGRTAYFFGDDYFGFWASETQPLSKTIAIPLGSQVVPLVRLVYHVVYHLWPLDYRVSVFVLLLFHALGVVYLYRVLDELGRSAWNPFLVCVYATFVHLWIQLAWWSPGLERLPFAALTFMALFYSLRYAKTQRSRYLWVLSACTVGALGFYGKAVFIPLYCAGLDAARARTGPGDPRFDLRDRKRWFVLAALTAFAFAFILGARAIVNEPSGFGNTTASLQFAVIEKSLVVFGHALVGVVLHFPEYQPSWGVGVWWLAVFCYTVFRAPATFVAWAIGVGLLVLNVLMLSLSVRSAMFGFVIPFEARYLFDLSVVAIPFLAVVLHQIPDTTREARWLTTAGRGILLPLAASLALVLLATASFRNVTRFAYEYATNLPRTRSYMTNVAEDLARLDLRGGHDLFAEGVLPTYISGLDVTFRTHAQLFILMHVPVRFTSPRRAEYRIDESGHIVRVKSH